MDDIFFSMISGAARTIVAVVRSARRTGIAALRSFLFGTVMVGCASQPELPLAHVDMPRMYGTWYIVATIPNWFEKGMVAPRDSFSRRPDGDIQEDFYLRRGSFAGPEKHYVVHDWVRANSDNAHWRVQVFWPIDLPFLVLYVDPNDRYVLFGEQDRALGWIYAREPVIADSEYRQLLARFSALGYDTTRFRKVIQLPEQVGMPGYWSEGIDR
jgi:apolipoprotein D and lipocalin family protein